MRKFLEFLETAFTVFSLMLYTGGPLTVIVKGGASDGISQGDTALIQLVFILIYIITFFLLAIRWKKSLYVIANNRNIIILILLATLSLLWSVYPSITFTRIVALIGTTLFGIYLSVRYNSLKKHLLIISLTFGVILILSLVFSLGLPKYGISSGIHAGSWRGIYYHKNAFGKWMVMSAVVFLLQCIKINKNLFIWQAALGLSLVMVVFSKSSAALIVFSGLTIICFLLGTMRLKYELMMPVISCSILLTTIITIWMLDNAEAILNIFGKDTTFTGRTDLWNVLIEMALERPWLGYGYGAFWSSNGAAEEVWRIFSWQPPNGHNGYIDIWLNVGLIGLLIFSLGFIKNLAVSLILVRRDGTPEAQLPFMLLIYLAISNFSETGLMVQNDFLWVVYVSLSYLLPNSLNNKTQVYA